MAAVAACEKLWMMDRRQIPLLTSGWTCGGSMSWRDPQPTPPPHLPHPTLIWRVRCYQFQYRCLSWDVSSLIKSDFSKKPKARFLSLCVMIKTLRLSHCFWISRLNDLIVFWVCCSPDYTNHASVVLFVSVPPAHVSKFVFLHSQVCTLLFLPR